MGARFCSAPHVVRCLRDRSVGLPARRHASAVAALRRAIRGSRARRRAGALACTAPGAQVCRRLRREHSHPKMYLFDCLVHACVRIPPPNAIFSASWDTAVAPCVLLRCVRPVDVAARFVRARQCRGDCGLTARWRCRLDRCVVTARDVRFVFPSALACGHCLPRTLFFGSRTATRGVVFLGPRVVCVMGLWRSLAALPRIGIRSHPRSCRARGCAVSLCRRGSGVSIRRAWHQGHGLARPFSPCLHAQVPYPVRVRARARGRLRASGAIRACLARMCARVGAASASPPECPYPGRAHARGRGARGGVLRSQGRAFRALDRAVCAGSWRLSPGRFTFALRHDQKCKS